MFLKLSPTVFYPFPHPVHLCLPEPCTICFPTISICYLSVSVFPTLSVSVFPTLSVFVFPTTVVSVFPTTSVSVFPTTSVSVYPPPRLDQWECNLLCSVPINWINFCVLYCQLFPECVRGKVGGAFMHDWQVCKRGSSCLASWMDNKIKKTNHWKTYWMRSATLFERLFTPHQSPWIFKLVESVLYSCITIFIQSRTTQILVKVWEIYVVTNPLSGNKFAQKRFCDK